jgi:hypothetical protein
MLHIRHRLGRSQATRFGGGVAAIERHRAAIHAVQNIDQDIQPDAYAEAEQEIAAA